jgi:hypothetical protein
MKAKVEQLALLAKGHKSERRKTSRLSIVTPNTEANGVSLAQDPSFARNKLKRHGISILPDWAAFVLLLAPSQVVALCQQTELVLPS